MDVEHNQRLVIASGTEDMVDLDLYTNEEEIDLATDKDKFDLALNVDVLDLLNIDDSLDCALRTTSPATNLYKGSHYCNVVEGIVPNGIDQVKAFNNVALVYELPNTLYLVANLPLVIVAVDFILGFKHDAHLHLGLFPKRFVL